MSLTKSTIVWSAKQIKGMVQNGKINFDHIVQRSYVWENSRKSSLIESIIIGYPIPAIYAKRIDLETEDKAHWCYQPLDGKQRLSTIASFLNDEFALTKIPEVTYYDDTEDKEFTLDISGKKFSELPDGLRSIIETSTINIIYFDELTSLEEKEMFKRLNNGKALSAKSKLLASVYDIQELVDFAKHSIFDELCTKNGLKNKDNVIIVYKILEMITKDISEVNLSGAKLGAFIEETILSTEDKKNIINILDYANEVGNYLYEDMRKKLFTETHFISIVPLINKAIENNISEDKFSGWFENFFTDEPIEYKNASSNAASSKTNVSKRNEILSTSFNVFLNNLKED